MYEDVTVRMPVVLASFVFTVSFAASAQADPGPDAGFLSALDKAGIPYQSGPTAISIGKKACDLMDQGQLKANVIQDVSASNPGLSMPDAARFTTIATSVYCPQHLGEPVTQAPPSPTSSPIIPEFPWPAPPVG